MPTFSRVSLPSTVHIKPSPMVHSLIAPFALRYLPFFYVPVSIIYMSC